VFSKVIYQVLPLCLILFTDFVPRTLGGSIAPSNRYCTHRATLVDEPAIMGRVLNIPCLCAGKTSSPQHLLPHVRIYSVADYLNMERLKVLAQNKAQDVVHAHWKDEKLQMVTALKEAFSNTPDHDQGMRQVRSSMYDCM
jgi:hypothetical protein